MSNPPNGPAKVLEYAEYVAAGLLDVALSYGTLEEQAQAEAEYAELFQLRRALLSVAALATKRYPDHRFGLAVTIIPVSPERINEHRAPRNGATPPLGRRSNGRR